MSAPSYVSTRGEAPPLDFAGAMLAGLAADGGLYTPERWPSLTRQEIAGLSGRAYAAVAGEIIGRLAGEAGAASLGPDLAGAYAGFRHAAVAPLVQIDDNLFVLELFHGPTLAFKDVAMQWLARAMDRELAARGRGATIVGATSGDTGAAAMAAFAGLGRVDVFILFPDGRVSDVQRRQMTTVGADNVHALALDGTFDDCQAIVKRLFADRGFGARVGLSGVNSINWARIAAQIVYYFTSAVALGAPGREVSFAVPTGNFGDVLAGYGAKRMGLPIGRLIVATNENDILARALADGAYEIRRVAATQSPSMDIQISSNFERVLFDALGRDAATTRALMAGLAQSGRFDIGAEALAALRRDFDAERVGEEETTEEIRRTYRRSGYVLDPHGAVGVAAGRRALQRNPGTPVVALATAHPAKFPDAVRRAIGRAVPLPDHLADLGARPERARRVANDVMAARDDILAHARLAREPR